VIEARQVLLVDDEPLVLKSVERLLARQGFRVEVAGNGREGLDKAMALRPDWIISDARMPVMDGPSMVRALRDLALSGVRIAFLSGFSDLTAADVAGLGVEAVLNKPVSSGVLLTLLRSSGE
jgi:CheY-like chemotaxis protein